MSTLRQAAQQALEALEAVKWNGSPLFIKATITALRAALAEPDPEPVAWMMINNNHKSLAPSLHWQPQQGWHITWEAVPLYTAPTPRKPLTRKELWAILASEQAYDKSGLDVFYRDQVIHLIRKAEAAHGIKEQEHGDD